MPCVGGNFPRSQPARTVLRVMLCVKRSYQASAYAPVPAFTRLCLAKKLVIGTVAKSADPFRAANDGLLDDSSHRIEQAPLLQQKFGFCSLALAWPRSRALLAHWLAHRPRQRARKGRCHAAAPVLDRRPAPGRSLCVLSRRHLLLGRP